MASRVMFRSSFVFIIFFSLSSFLATADLDEISLPSGTSTRKQLKTYIIRVKPPPLHVHEHPKSREAYHRSFLPVHLLESGEERLLYSYEHVVSGFAARLTGDDLAAMERKDGFVAAYPDELIPLQTTHSPDFLALPSSGAWNQSNFGEGVIIGILDSGIKHDHPSFACDLPPPPSSWKGQCEFGPNGCNKKIIGARGFTAGLKAMMRSGEIYGDADSLEVAPDDQNGHGTHVASTAAGCYVKDASSFGQAQGTAAGVAPRAYISAYKVCGSNGCPWSDILAGLDAAITDGVHIASMSIGGPVAPLSVDLMAVGTFRAVDKGILVSVAAGNGGPRSRSVYNQAPWMLTVAASSQDRSLRATVKLGNGIEYNGEALAQPKSFPQTQYPLISDGSCANLLSSNVAGKIVLCDVAPWYDRFVQVQSVKSAGGVAVIFTNSDNEGNTFSISPDEDLPTSQVSFSAGSEIKSYFRSVSRPTAAIIFKGSVIGGPFTPAIAYFSSRGPSITTPGIIKPDVTGPGLNILAAWPFQVGTSGSTSLFNIISGTSMATPHVSGAAALIKAVRPSWSASAIRSAIMTSATQTGSSGKPIEDHLGNPASPFDMGAGHINVKGAIDTNAAYEIGTNDYISLLCGRGYSDEEVGFIAGAAVSCSTAGSISDDQLNYPSFRIFLLYVQRFTRQVTRTLTNLMSSAITCTSLSKTGLQGVSVAVQPTTLTFSAKEKKQFTVTFSRNSSGTGLTVTGSLGWSCNGVILRSAVVVSF